MKQQKWEWLLALKRPVIWLIPLVITTLFILPMLRGRMVARGTTAAVLRDDASTVMESRDLATIRRVIKAGPKAQPTVMTYQQAKKLLPLAKKVTAAVNAGDRVAYPKAVTAFFSATDMRAPQVRVPRGASRAVL